MTAAGHYGYQPLQNPFDIIDTHFGPMERYRALGIYTSNIAALKDVYAVVRADSAAAQARSEQDANREELIRSLCAQIGALEQRIDGLTARLDQQEQERLARIEQEQQEPDPDDSLSFPDDGELIAVHGPSTERHKEELAASVSQERIYRKASLSMA
jgi:hypothetical protein